VTQSPANITTIKHDYKRYQLTITTCKAFRNAHLLVF